MRQVTYERPKDFVDAYAPPVNNPSLDQKLYLLRRRKKANSASNAHARGSGHRVAKQHKEKNSLSSNQKYDSDLFLWGNGGSSFDLEFGESSTFKSDTVGPCDDASMSQEGLDFGHVDRNIKITDLSLDIDPSKATFEALATISCWLVMVESTIGTLVVQAQLLGVKSLPAEAEIELSRLLEIRKISMENLEEDPSLLGVLSREILETVEMRIENGVPRLLLSFTANSWFQPDLDIYQ
jgi:hypothetical protein